MKGKDRLKIAYWNLRAGKQMVKKIVFGMMFVIMLLFCVLTILHSYFAYTEEFEQKHIADCYYYTLINDQELTDAWLAEQITYSQKEQERYQAKDISILLTLIPHNIEEQPQAGQTYLVLDGVDHQIDNYFLYNRKPYQNIYGESSPIELVLFREDIPMFTDKLTEEYGNEYLLGEYPNHPGEIMLDTYMLEMYGIDKSEEDLLGKTITLYCMDDNTEEVLLQDYVLTGILQGDYLSVRESLSSSDYHLEHIYVNLRAEDVERYQVLGGTVRYYFDNYIEYVEHYENKNNILQLNLSQISSRENTGIKLTEMGVEYCLLYWVMHNAGKLLLLVTVVIGLIITMSVLYIFDFYRNRNDRYFSMLENIGMEKKDRLWIHSIEMSAMMAMATVLGIYLAVLFLFLMSFVTKQVLDFPVMFDVRAGIGTVIFSWIYFWLLSLGLGRIK